MTSTRMHVALITLRVIMRMLPLLESFTLSSIAASSLVA